MATKVTMSNTLVTRFVEKVDKESVCVECRGELPYGVLPSDPFCTTCDILMHTRCAKYGVQVGLQCTLCFQEILPLEGITSK